VLAACFWLYLLNSVLLICHEIDSAYWKEWRMFGPLFGSGSEQRKLALFLVLHVPILLGVQWGLVESWKQSRMGLLFSLGLGTAGVFAFVLHACFLKRGRPEFRAPMSIALLIATLAVSLAQVVLAGVALATITV
jgi:dipeptide/tripeptide permease